MSPVTPSGAGRFARLRRRVVDETARVVGTLRLGRAPSARPLPRVRIRVGPWVPGAVVRSAPAVVALLCAALVVRGTGWWVLAVLAAALLVWRPSGIVAAGYAVALGLGLAVTPVAVAEAGARPYLLLLGIHLLAVLARLGSGLTWTAVVDLRVLAAPLRRALVLQVPCQLLALLGALLSGRQLELPWLPLLVTLGLAVLAWRLLAPLTGAADRDPEPRRPTAP